MTKWINDQQQLLQRAHIFSRTSVDADTSDLIKVKTTPIMAGTKNQLLINPGL